MEPSSVTSSPVTLNAFGWLSVITAVLSWLAFAMFAVYVIRIKAGSRYALMLLWMAHGCLFWAVSIGRRFFGGYMGPSVAMSQWGAAIQIQAFLSLIIYVIIHWARYLSDERSWSHMTKSAIDGNRETSQ